MRVNENVQRHFNNMKPDPKAYVSPENVKRLIEKLPTGKAGNDDKVVYEHLKACAEIISPVLSNVYTHMLRLGHVPVKMKTGNIITLHKGGNKRQDDPANYRAITLSSCILKLFEAVVLNRCESVILQSISTQQGGFQKGLGCMMTSLSVRECLHFARENTAKVYMCFLDGRQAFDHVWHQGLLYKLLEIGIDSTSLIAIKELYTDTYSSVKYNGLQSKSFRVRQGCPQGRKCSPIMYLVFIDGLIRRIEDSGFGLLYLRVEDVLADSSGRYVNDVIF